jgi:CRP-like cAMP-binding protein
MLGARVAKTFTWRPCPLRAKAAVRAALKQQKQALLQGTRVLLRGGTKLLLRGGVNGGGIASAAVRPPPPKGDGTLIASIMRSLSSPRSFRAQAAAGLADASSISIRGWLFRNRWALAANTACTLQMLQWACDDVVYLRSLNILAICFFTTYNMHMGAWCAPREALAAAASPPEAPARARGRIAASALTPAALAHAPHAPSSHPHRIYVSWDMLYTLINLIQIVRLLRERQDVALLPWEREIYESVFKHALSKQQGRALLMAAEPEALLRVGHEIVISRDEFDNHPIGLVLSGTLRMQVDGQTVGFIDRLGWFGHVHYKIEDDPQITLTAIEPTRVLQWSSLRLTELLEKDLRMDKGVHALWNVDMGRKLSRMDDEHRRRRLSHYLEIMHALAASGRLDRAELDFLRTIREKHSIDEATHAQAVEELALTRSLEPHLVQTLRSADEEDTPLPMLRRFVTTLTSMMDVSPILDGSEPTAAD